MSKKLGAIAKSVWRPDKREKTVLNKRTYLNSINRVDQIWPWLKQNNGSVLAVDAPHSLPAERFTYAELADKISLAAESFRSLGVQNGDVIALFSENSPRWLIVDQSLMRIGAANAVRGALAPIDELRYILEDSKAVGIIVQNAKLWDSLGINDSQKKQFKFVLQLEGKPLESLLGWEDFLLSRKETKKLDNFTNITTTQSPLPIATILYTSGTTGKPKGVPLTHSNLLHQIRALACIANPLPGSPFLSVLPIWHSYERSAEYYFFSCGCTQTYTTIKNLKQDLQKVRPIVMATVPRLWEAVKLGFDDAIKQLPRSRKRLLEFAFANSKSYKHALRRTRNLMLVNKNFLQRFSALLEVGTRFPLHMLSTLFLWKKVVRQLCGGRLRFPINGGGAIAPHVDEFFETVGIELLVGYGLTETSPVVSCRRPWRNIRGSAGSPLPGTEFKIVDPDTGKLLNFMEQGLVFVKGPQVMKGYLGKPDETIKVLDSEGWLNTGDLGMLLFDGSLVLTGRAKDTIVLSNGENIEPGPLEEFLVSSPIIEQIMLIGQDEKKLGALVVPNVSLLISWAKDRGVFILEDFELLSTNKDLRNYLKQEINLLLSKRAGARSDERIGGLALVQPFSIENGLLTQTLKQKRKEIIQRDSEHVKEIFNS